MAKTKRGLSEAERAERRARDRERLQDADDFASACTAPNGFSAGRFRPRNAR